MKTPPPTVKKAMTDVKPAVMTIALTDWLADNVLRPLSKRTRVWVAAGLVGAAPLLVTAVLAVVAEPPSSEALAWICVYALLTLWLVSTARWSFACLCDVGGDLDRMFFRDCDRAPVTGWIEKHVRPKLQFTGCALVGVASAVAVSFLEIDAGVSEGRVAWYVVTGMTLFWACDTVSWLVRIPWVVRRLRKVSRLKVIRHSPVMTRGFRRLSCLLVTIAALSAVGFILFATPLVWSVLLEFNVAAEEGRPRPWHIVWWTSIPLLGTVALNLYVAFIAQLWLAAVVNRQRKRILDEIGEGLLDSGQPTPVDADDGSHRSLYDALAAAPTRTVVAGKLLTAALSVVASGLLPALNLALRVFDIESLFGVDLKRDAGGR